MNTITVERNFHCMNEDRFIMEKISYPIEIEEGADIKTVHEKINEARQVIVDNFKAAYPHLRTYLNFDEVVQVNKEERNFKEFGKITEQDIHNRIKELDDKGYFKNAQLPIEKINKGTIEEQIQAFNGTVEELKREWYYIAMMNKKATIAYNEKLAELESKLKTNKQEPTY